MDQFTRRIRKPVEREGAARYIRLTLLSFAATVTLVRLFLQLTGYPQLGNGTLHIAHLLWGGLLLFVGALVMLILANRWAYTLGALLTGAGVGLFIDEVGKFITRSNDYFYPPAAPVIYVFFLLVVLLYLEIRRPPRREARAELYRAFDSLQEVLDRDLDAQERATLKSRLQAVADQADHPDQSRLAKELLRFLRSRAVEVVPLQPGWLERGIEQGRAFTERWITQVRLRAVLVSGLTVMGGWALVDLIRWLIAVRPGGPVEPMLAGLIVTGRIIGGRSLAWFVATLGLKASIGLLLLLASVFLAAGRDTPGIRLAYLGLLLCLTVVDLMEFYFMQFATILPAGLHFLLLLGVLEFQRLYHAKMPLTGSAESTRLR